MKKQIKYLLTGVALVLTLIYLTDYSNLNSTMLVACPYLTGVALGFWCGDFGKDKRHRRYWR